MVWQCTTQIKSITYSIQYRTDQGVKVHASSGWWGRGKNPRLHHWLHLQHLSICWDWNVTEADNTELPSIPLRILAQLKSSFYIITTFLKIPLLILGQLKSSFYIMTLKKSVVYTEIHPYQSIICWGWQLMNGWKTATLIYQIKQCLKQYQKLTLKLISQRRFSVSMLK